MKLLMNPPYKFNSSLKVLNVVCKLFNTADIVSLQPCLWLQDYNALKDPNSFRNSKYKHIVSHIQSLKIINADDNRNLFNSRGPTDLGIFCINMQKKGIKLDPLKLRGHSKIAYSILKKIFDKTDTFSNHIVIAKPLNNYSVVYSHMCGLTKLHDFVYVNGKDSNGKSYRENVKNQHKNDFPRTHFEFNTFEEAENFRKYLWTNTFKFVEKVTQPGLLRIFQSLPYIYDYKQEWTDEKMLKYFNFTEEEIEALKTPV